MSREPFVMVPRALLYAGLSPRCLHAWAVLDDLCRARPNAIVTQASWAAAIGVQSRQLRTLITDLVDAEFVAVLDLPGTPSGYAPLQRPRAVDNSREPVLVPRQNIAGDPGRKLPGSGALALSIHAREQGQEALGSGGAVDNSRPRRPAWCGVCDPDTRLDDQVTPIRRCHRCHPIASADPAF